MAKNEFTSPIAVDFAPSGSKCAWCGETAEHELTAIGGAFHNMSALFCRSCGNEFIKTIIGSYDQGILVAPKRGKALNTPSLGAAYSEMPGD